MDSMKKRLFNLIGYRRDYFQKDFLGKGKIWVIYIYAPYISKHINKLLRKYYFKDFNILALKYNEDSKYICYIRKWLIDEKKYDAKK